MARIVKSPPNRRTADGMMSGGWWHEVEESGRIVCDLCPRACSLKPGDRGFCFVRENTDGEIVLTTYGRSTGFCVDPIEKKPLNHFLPGTAVLSFGTAGCNLGCKFCQNWDISKSREVERASEQAEPETIAEAAAQLGCHSVAFTYNDPVIWAEYAIDTARACRRRGIRTVAVTAGYISPEARPAFFDVIDAANVDLKAFREEFYQQLTYSHIQPVLDTLAWLKRETEVWFEITNLIIPQENDSLDEIRRLCDWVLANVGDEVPLHFTAFHPDFRLRDRPPTPLETLLSAYDTATSAGIKYVYVGNVHDPQHDSTYCPNCRALLIQRNWHELGTYHLRGNECRSCGAKIAGHFLETAGTWGRRRLPIRIADYARPNHVTADRIATKGDSAMATPDDPPTSAEAGPRTRPLLTERQELLVLRAACEIVVAGIQNRAPSFADPTLDGVADQTVAGAFVTLKREGHLRACCGSLGHPMPLMEALKNAAHRTATGDVRLPPISATELPFLHVDVSLLHNFQTVTHKGTGRLGAVEVGRHGLTIHRGQSGGLLLPSVPLENGWDAEMFLRQVCRKAGLSSNAWEDDDARLQTFEAVVIEGQIDTDLLPDAASVTPGLFAPGELSQLVEHCRANVIALVQGATPSYYLPSCRDTEVQGIALALALPSQATAPQFARSSLRPGLPLQSTLYQLAESAAQWILSQQLPDQLLPDLVVDLAILYDSSLHGTVADPDLHGLDPRRRALMVIEHGRYAWMLDPDRNAASLLEATARKAQVLNPAAAGVFSFAADASRPIFTCTNVPVPQTGPAVRPAAVAGVFYPKDGESLDEMVNQLITGCDETLRERWSAVLVPHAGLRYSGRIAAEVFTQVEIPDRAIILAPKHTRLGTPWAVAPCEAWSIPGHVIPSDPDLARRLADGIPGLQLDAAAHREEHAIEVELPLLAQLAPHTRVVGIVIGDGDLDQCRQFGKHLAEVIRQEASPPLLVISTDMNHYATEDENRQLDQIALNALVRLDAGHLLRTVREHDISMCGVLPAVVVLEALRDLGALRTCRQVAYATSADAGGSSDRVVGYAGMLFR